MAPLNHSYHHKNAHRPPRVATETSGYGVIHLAKERELNKVPTSARGVKTLGFNPARWNWEPYLIVIPKEWLSA